MSDISEAERLAIITREQVRLVNLQTDLIEEEEHEHSARAFNIHRRATRPFSTAAIIPFPRRQP